MDPRGHVNRGRADAESLRNQNSPIVWRQHGLRLSRSALVLAAAGAKGLQARGQIRDEFDKGGSDWPAAALLAGYSLEAHFKGMEILKRCGSGEPSATNFSHPLLGLAKDADVGLCADEQHICALLSEFIIYLGKYPTAKTAKHMHDGWGLSIYTFDMYERLFGRIDMLFLERLRSTFAVHSTSPTTVG